jgi:hypothetical protein
MKCGLRVKKDLTFLFNSLPFVMKTMSQKIQILENRGWKLVNSMFFGGRSFATYSNPKNGMIIQFSAESETNHCLSILP